MESDDGQGCIRASERFYAELTDRYREKLVERAVSLYDGKAGANTRTIPKSKCAVTAVQQRLRFRHGWM